MVLTKEQVNIIEDKPEISGDNMFSTVSTSENLADVFTRKKAKTMHPNVGKLKPAELTLPTSQQEYDDRKKSLVDKLTCKLTELKTSDISQVDGQEDYMPKNYKDIKRN